MRVFTMILILILPVFVVGLNSSNGSTITLSKKDIAELESMSRQIVVDGESPRVVVVLQQNNKNLFTRSYGFKDLATKTPIKSNDIFSMGALTYPAYAAAIMILRDENKLKLSDPMFLYVPEFKDLTVMNPNDPYADPVPLSRPITIKDMLSQQSGFVLGFVKGGGFVSNYSTAYYIMFLSKMSGMPFTSYDAALTLNSIVLDYQPGTSFQFSLESHYLSIVIEKASGMSVQEFMKKKLFMPLEMKDTGFYLNSEQKKRFVDEVVFNKEKQSFALLPNSQIKLYDENLPFLLDGVFSTADDYSRFMYMILSNGKYGDKQIISPESVSLMLTRTNSDFAGVLKFYNMDSGLGVYLLRDDSKVWAGSYKLQQIGGFVYADPENDVILTVFTGCHNCSSAAGEPVWDPLVNKVYNLTNK